MDVSIFLNAIDQAPARWAKTSRFAIGYARNFPCCAGQGAAANAADKTPL